VPVLSAGVATAEAAEELRLVRLAQLTGVNALASGQEIAFNPKLTVLLGENAAGKTGYVRVLKRVASVRSAQPRLGDINSTASGKPHATIDYTLAGAAWRSQDSVDTQSPRFLGRFELLRAHAAEMTVAAGSIVEGIDVVGGLLKIAYEVAYLALGPDYLDDPVAKEIRVTSCSLSTSTGSTQQRSPSNVIFGGLLHSRFQ
jgi:hypothetical protein